MLIYFEQINEAIDTVDISRIYPYGRYSTESDSWESTFQELEKGVDPKDLVKTEALFKSTILLKNNSVIHSKLEPKEIIQALRESNGII